MHRSSGKDHGYRRRHAARWIAGSIAVYRCLLIVYPRSFRRRNEARMIETFADLCAEAVACSGLRGLLVLWLRTIRDLADNGLSARRNRRPGSSAPRRGDLMESFLVDLRYALRALRRSPGFAAVAIVTMAVGIGANAAMFSFVDAVVLRTLPFHQPGRLVEVWETFERDDLELRNVGYPTFLDWRARNSSFEDIGATVPSAFALTEVGEAQRILGELADPQYFEILGVTHVLDHREPGGQRRLH